MDDRSGCTVKYTGSSMIFNPCFMDYFLHMSRQKFTDLLRQYNISFYLMVGNFS
jgi:hypothetical protein